MDKKNLLLIIVPEEFKEDKLCLKGILSIIWGIEDQVPPNLDIVVGYCAFPANLVFIPIVSYNRENVPVTLSENIYDTIDKYNKILVLEDINYTTDLTKFMVKDITYLKVTSDIMCSFNIYPDGYVCTLLGELLLQEGYAEWLSENMVTVLNIILKTSTAISKESLFTHNSLFTHTRPLARVLEFRFADYADNIEDLYYGIVSGFITKTIQDSKFTTIMADVTDKVRQDYTNYQKQVELMDTISFNSELLGKKAMVLINKAKDILGDN